MSIDDLVIPHYAAKLYIPRRSVEDLVIKKIEEVRWRSSDAPPVVPFLLHGYRGSGKTWFSLHLKRTVLPKMDDVESFLIRLYPVQDPFRSQEPCETEEKEVDVSQSVEEENIEERCEEIVDWMANQVLPLVPSGAALKDTAEWLVRALEKKVAAGKIIVFIFDSVFEANWEFLDRLESCLLSRLAAMRGVLLVITGRGPLYSWASPLLRLAQPVELEPFSEDEIQDQIAALGYSKPVTETLVKQLGGGYPLSNLILAHLLDDQAHALNALLDLQLTIIKDKDLQKTAQTWFKALCVLDSFRDIEVTPLLKAFHEEDPGYQPPVLEHVRTIRSSLQATNLICWKDGAFVMDKSLRHVAEQLLKSEIPTPQTWLRLCQGAHDMFQKWAKELPRYRQFYEEKAKKYSDAIKEEQGIE